MCSEIDIEYMRECMALANEAEARDEVPVGAIVVRNGRVFIPATGVRIPVGMPI